MQFIPNEWLLAYGEPANRGITMYLSDGSEIFSDRIVENSFKIDRSCCSGSRLEIGALIASELTVTLKNGDGYYDARTFEGEEIRLALSARLASGYIARVTVGYFTIDSPPRKLTTIKLNALDRMVHLDKEYDTALLFPATVREIYHDVLDNCNLISGTTETALNALPNIDYIVSARPEEDGLTYRQVMRWIAELTGTIGYIDNDGAFRLVPPPMTITEDAPRITTAERFASDLQEQDITVTGVQITTDETTYLAGEEGYVLNIEGNMLVQYDPETLASALGAALCGFEYRPFSCEAKAMPQLWPMDSIVFVDSNGVEHPSIVTNITLGSRGHCSLSAKGETTTQAGYAAINPLTKGERVILSKLKREQNAKLDSVVLATFHLNQMIGGSLGLYATDVVEENGSTTHYWHDAATLEESSTIYTFGAGGYAWTTEGWNDGSPVWNYGADKNGNAVYNALYAYKITADMIKVDSLQAICAKIGGWSIGDTYLQSVGSMTPGGTMIVSLNSYEGDSVSAAFKVYAGSHIYFAVNYDGSMLATKGTIAGWTISDTSISSSTDSATFKLASSASTAEDWICASVGTDRMFKVSKTGVLTATGANISGVITAEEGTIGGWKLKGSRLQSGSTGMNFIISANEDANESWISASFANTVTFKVTKAGELFATRGTIAGWTIGTSYFGTQKSLSYNTSYTTCAFYISSATDDGSSYWVRAHRGEEMPFSVSKLGVLTATGASISGSVTATSFKAIGAGGVYQATMTETGFRVQDNTTGTSNGYVELQKNMFYAYNASGDYSFAFNGATRMTITDSGGTTVGTWLSSSSVADASDETVKHDVETLSNAYSALFDALRPVRFRYNDGTSDRYHTGLIAQEVEEAVKDAGLTTQELAAFIRDKNGRCWLRYSEFIAINIAEIQKLKARVTELERMMENG